MYTVLLHLDTHARKLPEQQSPSDENAVTTVAQSPAFLPTIIQGIIMANAAQTSTAHHSFALLHYWIEYVISFLPLLHGSLPNVITAIITQFCDITRENAVAGIDSLRSQAIQESLDGMRRILNFCIAMAPKKQYVIAICFDFLADWIQRLMTAYH